MLGTAGMLYPEDEAVAALLRGYDLIALVVADAAWMGNDLRERKCDDCGALVDGWGPDNGHRGYSVGAPHHRRGRPVRAQWPVASGHRPLLRTAGGALDPLLFRR